MKAESLIQQVVEGKDPIDVLQISTGSDGEDKSNNPTVVEYGVREMMKGKNPTAAAKTTATKLSGSENLLLGSGVVYVDPKKLEEALWLRLVIFTIDGMERIKKGMEHFALDGTIQNFQQKPKIRAMLKSRVIKYLGENPFINDDR